MRVIGTERGNECKVLLCPQDVKLDCEVMGSKFSSPQTSRVSDPVELVKSTGETHFLYKIQRGLHFSSPGWNSPGHLPGICPQFRWSPWGWCLNIRLSPLIRFFTCTHTHTHTYRYDHRRGDFFSSLASWGPSSVDCFSIIIRDSRIPVAYV